MLGVKALLTPRACCHHMLGLADLLGSKEEGFKKEKKISRASHL